MRVLIVEDEVRLAETLRDLDRKSVGRERVLELV